ncbi:TPA: hypothetical protein DCR49_01710 [Candidatus Delongbacteria bacterium]|nr:MAG: hypothetical protein A2Y39_03855 [Candidatus Delongbacteria bacterium GWF2_40_14]HAQ60710.1 hypothetical protein [Candidatus Delongbacteria bacterium]
MRRLCLLAGLAVFLILPVNAQDQNIINGNKLESWYTYWGLGYGTSQYPDAMQKALDAFEEIDGVTRTEIAVDMFGFYFPVNGHHTAVGFVIDGVADAFDYDGETVQFNQYIYAASAMHFFNETVGKGFFVRGDLGFAYLNVESTIDNFSATSDSGIGLLIGGGYGFNLGAGTRCMLNLNYSYRGVEGDTYTALGITAGFMF